MEEEGYQIFSGLRTPKILIWTWVSHSFLDVHKNANRLSESLALVVWEFISFHFKTHSKWGQHLNIVGGFSQALIVWELCLTGFRVLPVWHFFSFSFQFKEQSERMFDAEACSEHTWWREFQENRLKPWARKYFIHKCSKYHQSTS